MSGAFAAGSALVSVGSQALSASGVNFGLLLTNTRKIDTIIPDVVVSEHHTDRTTITQHPVADNTPIQDHAFMMPKTLVMQCGWSNSASVASAVQGFMSGGVSGAASSLVGSFTEQRCKDIYEKLIALQKQRKPFTVTTGKRSYPNMLIAELTSTTDRHSEYALFVSCTMQEIILVQTATATAPSQQAQASPQKTAAVDDKGTTQASPRDSSAVGGWIEKTLRSVFPASAFSPSSGS